MPSVSRTEPKTKFWRSVTVGNFCTNVQSPGHRHLISRLYYRRSAAVYRRLRCAACLLSRKDCSVMKKINSTNNAEQPRPRVVCFSFDQPIVASGSRLSYARILLFPASTQYPAGSPITSLLNHVIASDNAHSFACVLLFSTQVQKYLAWVL